MSQDDKITRLRDYKHDKEGEELRQHFLKIIRESREMLREINSRTHYQYIDDVDEMHEKYKDLLMEVHRVLRTSEVPDERLKKAYEAIGRLR